MNILSKLIIVSALTMPLFAQAEGADICKPVFEACAAQGYSKDETAPAGKKIWLNCANVIINQKKAVAKVDMDPNSFDAKNCHDFREARDQFEADWAKNHKKEK